MRPIRQPFHWPAGFGKNGLRSAAAEARRGRSSARRCRQFSWRQSGGSGPARRNADRMLGRFHGKRVAKRANGPSPIGQGGEPSGFERGCTAYQGAPAGRATSARGVEDREHLIGDGVVEFLRLYRLAIVIAARAEFEPVSAAPVAIARPAARAVGIALADVADGDLVHCQFLPWSLGKVVGTGPSDFDRDCGRQL